jgi:hypothetical protein
MDSNVKGFSGWGLFYTTVCGPEVSPRKMVLDVLKTQDRPMTIRELKLALKGPGMQTGKFGTRFTYLYHLLYRLDRAKIIRWERNGGVYLNG